MNSKLLLLLFCPFATFGIDCDLVLPNAAAELNSSQTLGFLFIPGAKIPGENYLPLVSAVLDAFPGSAWGALTTDWIGDLPDSVQIVGAIDACIGKVRKGKLIKSCIAHCLSKAVAAGLNTANLYMSGHSKGGIALASHLRKHPDAAVAIALLGSYLTENDNAFPVPVLTAIGTLDGMTLSNMPDEFSQSETFTVLIEDVNHGQVATGELPSKVIEDDIDPELSDSEALDRYAAAIADFLVLTTPNEWWMGNDNVETSRVSMEERREFTRIFLQPFYEMSQLEIRDGNRSPWVEESQLHLLGSQEENAMVVVLDTTLNAAELAMKEPEIEDSSHILVYSSLQHELNSGDSATSIKAKMKSAEAVSAALNLPWNPDSRTQCSELNQRALRAATEAASEAALNRYEARGRKLVFAAQDDVTDVFYPGWVTEFGLNYTLMEDQVTVLLSTKTLLSDMEEEALAGMNYCDLLSPYRALEWIYINSLTHGFHT